MVGWVWEIESWVSVLCACRKIGKTKAGKDNRQEYSHGSWVSVLRVEVEVSTFILYCTSTRRSRQIEQKNVITLQVHRVLP